MRHLKYLGAYVDDALSWRRQVEQVSARCARAIGRLWRHGDSLTLVARRSWYISMVQSTLSYASNAYFPSLSASLLDTLTKLAKSGIRTAFRLHNPVATAPLLVRLNVSLPVTLYRQKLAVFVFRCINDRCSHLFSSYFLPAAHRAQVSQITRGQNSDLLLVPFCPGPAGRKSIQFVGAVLWNNLPALARSEKCLANFKVMISALPLSTAPLVASCFTVISHSNSDNSSRTRGEVAKALRYPTCVSASGERRPVAKACLLWNALPSHVRLQPTAKSFAQELECLDLSLF